LEAGCYDVAVVAHIRATASHHRTPEWWNQPSLTCGELRLASWRAPHVKAVRRSFPGSEKRRRIVCRNGLAPVLSPATRTSVRRQGQAGPIWLPRRGFQAHSRYTVWVWIVGDVKIDRTPEWW